MRHGVVNVGFRERFVLAFTLRNQQYVVSARLDRATWPQRLPHRVLGRRDIDTWVHDFELREPTGESILVGTKPSSLVGNVRHGRVFFHPYCGSVLDQESNESWERG